MNILWIMPKHSKKKRTLGVRELVFVRLVVNRSRLIKQQNIGHYYHDSKQGSRNRATSFNPSNLELKLHWIRLDCWTIVALPLDIPFLLKQISNK